MHIPINVEGAPFVDRANKQGPRHLFPGESFRDGPDCPEMVVVPQGSFLMGSPDNEPGRFDDEGPVHEVTIGYWLAVAKHPVTRGEWRRYLVESGRTGSRNAFGFDVRTWQFEKREEYCWSNTGFPQEDSHPVVCVSWSEAQEYSAWLTQKTGQRYRLLSESEYEYVNRAGTRSAYWWGDSSEEQWRHANGADAALKARHNNPNAVYAAGNCGFVYTSPVGHFPPNPFGLHDTSGNVWCWTHDRWHENYKGAPADGSAWESGGEAGRVMRGGSWLLGPWYLRSAYRFWGHAGLDSGIVGFRVARTAG